MAEPTPSFFFPLYLKEYQKMSPQSSEPPKKPDPERMALLRALPLEIKQQISGEEAHAFLFHEDMPESLLEKLKEYLVADDH